jgi:ABC-type transporter MlaC component
MTHFDFSSNADKSTGGEPPPVTMFHRRRTMRTRNALAALVLSTVCLVSLPAVAGESEAQSFVEQKQGRISQLLRQPSTATRDAQVDQELGVTFDYDELTKRIFGLCPAGISCVDNWTSLTAAQKAEMTGLFKKLVQKTYRKNLIKTLDYEITFRGSRASVQNESKIQTEAKSKVKPRDPSTRIDYVVRGSGDAYRVVDIVTEGSSLTANYREQVAKMLREHDYAYVAKKITDKANAP